MSKIGFYRKGLGKTKMCDYPLLGKGLSEAKAKF
jgi:hypothetical protein